MAGIHNAFFKYPDGRVHTSVCTYVYVSDRKRFSCIRLIIAARPYMLSCKNNFPNVFVCFFSFRTTSSFFLIYLLEDNNIVIIVYVHGQKKTHHNDDGVVDINRSSSPTLHIKKNINEHGFCKTRYNGRILQYSDNSAS